MSKIKALRDKKGGFYRQAEAILNAAEGRELTAEEDAKFTALKADMDRLQVLIDAEELEQDRERQMVGRPPEGLDTRLDRWPHRVNETRRPVNGRTYAEMFGATHLSNGGWACPDEFLERVALQQHDPRLQLMSSGSGPSGGFMVPEQYAARMMDEALENEIVRPRAQIEPMTTDTKKISGLSDVDHSTGSLFGGFAAEWLTEGGQATDKQPKFRKIELNAKKLALFTYASNELLADGTGLEQQLFPAMTSAASWHLDYAFLRGTGAGQPLGVLNDPARVTVDPEVAQDPDTIIYENLIKMLARLHPACFARSVWLCSSTAIPQLLTLVIPTILSGQAVPVLTESGDGFRILTRPVIFTEKVPAVGDEGDISLVDLSQYVVGMRKEVSVERSMHVRWQTDEMSFRGIVRCDGQGKWAQAFTPRTGDSQSWVITLGAR